MKRIILGLAAISILMACNSTGTTEAKNETAVETAGFGSNEPIIKFDSAIYNFGKIKTGDQVSHEFKFTNIGQVPLIIKDAKASCGCTTPEFTREPIKPGESGSVHVIFDSSGKTGIQDKMITIIANTTPEQNNVHLVGEIEAK
jgi:hypothetical protein